MPRKVLDRLSLDDRDPDGFHFPTTNAQKRARKNSSSTKTKTKNGSIEFKKPTAYAAADLNENGDDFMERSRKWITETYPKETYEIINDVLENKEVVLGLGRNMEQFKGNLQRLLERELGLKTVKEIERESARAWKIDRALDEAVVKSLSSVSVSNNEEFDAILLEMNKEFDAMLLELPRDVRDVIFRFAGVKSSAALACCCKDLRDEVRSQRMRSVGTFILRERDVRTVEQCRMLIKAYPNVTGIVAEKILQGPGSVVNAEKIYCILWEVIEASKRVDSPVRRLGFRRNLLSLIDLTFFIRSAGKGVTSFDFSGNFGKVKRKANGDNIHCPMCPSDYFTNIPHTEYDFELSMIRDEGVHGWDRDSILDQIEHVEELNVSLCDLQHHFDLYFFLLCFKGLKRLNCSMNYCMKINEPSDQGLIQEYERNLFVKRSPASKKDCKLENLNLSGMATKVFVLKPSRTIDYNPIKSWNNLRELNLSLSANLEICHLQELPNLKVLNLVNCKKLKELFLFGLDALETLSLDICRSLSKIQFLENENEKIQCKSLLNLSINQCDSMSHHSMKLLLESAVNLEYFRAEGIVNKEVEEITIPSASLISVDISGFKMLKSIRLKSAKLKILRARNCRTLEEICNRSVSKTTSASSSSVEETMVEIDVRNSKKLKRVTGLLCCRQNTRIRSVGAESLQKIETM